ncbi:MAG: crossover junction endodeoxyribonuclease RuvC [Deltaproteobacteria bacterium]|nr:crossover junction endodeoxyribonuclease RuvC [Deltaproteobacteria bacterium]MCL5277820.1 crossover junction endodeoxyribonuclease RuvC [Deltaproteobacteria bacterium]
MRILGIDPGSRIMGWALIESDGNGYRHVSSGIIDSKDIHAVSDRLLFIYREVGGIIDSYGPDAAAIETVFFSRNQRSAFVLVQTAAAAMIAALNSGVPVSEYQPMMIKKALSGYGRADKEQVQLMVRRLLNIDHRLIADTSDAMAVAICHINSVQFKNRLAEHALSH